MTLTKNEKIEKNQYELQFSIDKATFDAAVNAVYRKQVKKINIPGFRQGKAPRAIVEKMYGSGIFYEDAINDLLPGNYMDALKESGLTPVSQPEFDVVSIDENGLVLSAKFFVKPDVEIKDYKGIAVTKPAYEVTDEAVDSEIASVRERNARESEVTDRAAVDGDKTVIDFEGFCDGVAFEGGKGTDHTLKLGSGQFIPGFEEQIVGKQIGESFDINVTFPAEYHAENLAGKEAVFKVTLKSITAVELPALDDDFAKDVSEFDTFDEYKADVKAKLIAKHEKEADNVAEEAILNALIEKLEADIPQGMYDTEVENEVRDYETRLRMNGLDLGTYFKYTGMTMDQLRAQMAPQAERQVKTRLALEKIAALENLEASEEDIAKEYEDIAKAWNREVDEVKKAIPTESIVEDMKVKKAIELVKSTAVITVEEEAAAPAEAE